MGRGAVCGRDNEFFGQAEDDSTPMSQFNDKEQPPAELVEESTACSNSCDGIRKPSVSGSDYGIDCLDVRAQVIEIPIVIDVDLLTFERLHKTLAARIVVRVPPAGLWLRPATSRSL